MPVTPDDIQITKVLSGFFFPQDMRFDHIKGDFFNKLKEVCNFESDLSVLKFADLNILKTIQFPNFEVRMTEKTLNYENTFDENESFINTSISIAEAWNEVSDCNFIKVGGVIDLVVQSELNPADFISKYYTNINIDNIKTSKLHINYPVIENENEYNVNLTVACSDEIVVKLDINLSNEEAPYISLDKAREILNYLFDFSQNQLIDFLNSGE